MDGMLDLLSDILTRLSLRGTLYFRTSFTEPWGVRGLPFATWPGFTSRIVARRLCGWPESRFPCISLRAT